MSKGRLIGIIAAVVFVLYAVISSTIVKEGQEALLTGEKVFDPSEVAKNFWKEKSKAYFEKEAVDLVTLLTEANGDFSSVAKKYGHYSMGDSGALSFIVKGSGKITEVKNKLRSGFFVFDLNGNPSEDIKTRIQVGPVFKGSAVRDSISLINYDDYKNQIEWAEVSKALHDKVLSDIIAPVKPGELAGKKIEFIGCFTVGSQPDTLHITPVSIKVLE